MIDGNFLIFPKLIEIARLDTQATAATALGYDHSLNEPRVSNPNDGVTPRTGARRETLVQLEGQVETDVYRDMQMGPIGNAPRSRLVIVFLRVDLEALGLADPTTKEVLLKPTDRLVRIADPENIAGGWVVIPEKPGLYATQVEPTAFGFGPGLHNLVPVHFNERATATRGAGAGTL